MKLIDTNVIAYAYDKKENTKREKCLNLLNKIFSGKEKGILTNQILGELFYTLTKNFKEPLDKEKAQQIVNSIIDSNYWIKLDYTHKTIQKAIEISRKFSVHFWDALIVATMDENNISSIITENEDDFKKIPYIKVINPLK